MSDHRPSGKVTWPDIRGGHTIFLVQTSAVVSKAWACDRADLEESEMPPLAPVASAHGLNFSAN